MRRCVKILLLVMFSFGLVLQPAVSASPFSTLRNFFFGNLKQKARALVPKPGVPGVDGCILGTSLTSIVVGLWWKSWVFEAGGVGGVGFYGYRRLAGAEERLRKDIKNVESKVDGLQRTVNTVNDGVDNANKNISALTTNVQTMQTNLIAVQTTGQGTAEAVKRLETVSGLTNQQLAGVITRVEGTQAFLDNFQQQYAKDKQVRQTFEGTLFERMGTVDSALVQNTTTIQGLSKELVAATTVINEILDQGKKTEQRLQSVEGQNAQLLAEQKKQGTELTVIGKNVQTLVATVNALCRQGEQTGKDVRFSRNMIGAGLIQQAQRVNGVNGIIGTFPTLLQSSQKSNVSGSSPRLSITGTPQ